MAKKLTAEIAEKFLSNVPTEKGFYFGEGFVVGSIEGLYNALDELSDEQFACHRNKEKNDFYNWIVDVIGDVRLANEIARTKTKNTLMKRIKQRMDSLKKIAGVENA